jgi:hypothetical protein
MRRLLTEYSLHVTTKDEKLPLKKFVTYLYIFSTIIVLMIIRGALKANGINGNITWTFFWLFLTITSWKYYRWRAIVPFFLYVLAAISVGFFAVITGSSLSSWERVATLAIINLGGLVMFTYAYFSPTKIGSITKLHPRDKEKNNSTNTSEEILETVPLSFPETTNSKSNCSSKSERQYCSDDACPGYIIGDCYCDKCGKDSNGILNPYLRPMKIGKTVFCSEALCIGIVGADGKCQRCGKKQSVNRSTNPCLGTLDVS